MACQRNLILLALVIFCILNVKAGNEVTPRIVGGQATTITHRPYLVNLRKGGRFFCGGTLVRPKFVVSAGHCVKGIKKSDLSVHAGDTYLSRTGVVRRVANIYIPAAFNLKTLVMDVSVLKLVTAMTGPNIKPIPLCTYNLKPGNQLFVSGWGLQNENSRDVPNQVRTAQVKILKKSRCAREYRGKVAIRSTMMCASIPGRKDACTGDSGGPLVLNNQLCGVVSFGIGCGRTAYPGVYTRVSSVRSFINASLKK